MCDLLQHVSCAVSACIVDGLGRGSICFDVKLILMLHVGLSDRVGSSLGFLPTSSQCSGVMLSWVFALVSATKFVAMLVLIMPRPGSDLLVGSWLSHLRMSRLRSWLVNYLMFGVICILKKSVINYCHERLKFG